MEAVMSAKERVSHDLTAGEFYSPVLRQLKRADFTLSELRHATPERFPEHTHEAAYFSLLLEGSYAEDLGRKRYEHEPMSITWHPPAITHRDEVGPVGARFFTVEVRPALLEKLRECARVPEETFAARNELSWLGIRLFKEFRTADAASPLVIEGLLLEMLAGAARFGFERGARPPAWLERVIERLRTEFSGNVRLEDLAAEAGVHPVHLSAAFRRYRRETLGEHVRKLRVARALELLTEQEMPLAGIAAAAGFSDQSHLTRVFKRHTGITPGAFRRTLSS